MAEPSKGAHVTEEVKSPKNPDHAKTDKLGKGKVMDTDKDGY